MQRSFRFNNYTNNILTIEFPTYFSLITLQKTFNCVYIRLEERTFNVSKRKRNKHSFNSQFEGISRTSILNFPQRISSIYLFYFNLFSTLRAVTASLAAGSVKVDCLFLSKCVLSAKIINSTLVFVIASPRGNISF